MRVTSLVTEIPWTCFLRRSMRFVLSFPFVQHIDLPMYVRSYGASEFKYLWELKSLQSLSCFEVVPNDTLEVLRQGLTGLCELDLRVSHDRAWGKVDFNYHGVRLFVKANRAHLRKLTLKFHLQNMRDSELFEFFSSLPNLEILEICSLSIECGQKKRFFLSSKLHSLRFENCPTLTNGWVRINVMCLVVRGTNFYTAIAPEGSLHAGDSDPCCLSASGVHTANVRGTGEFIMSSLFALQRCVRYVRFDMQPCLVFW